MNTPLPPSLPPSPSRSRSRSLAHALSFSVSVFLFLSFSFSLSLSLPLPLPLSANGLKTSDPCGQGSNASQLPVNTENVHRYCQYIQKMSIAIANTYRKCPSLLPAHTENHASLLPVHTDVAAVGVYTDRTCADVCISINIVGSSSL